MSIVPSMLLTAVPEGILTVELPSFGVLTVTLVLCAAALCAGAMRPRSPFAPPADTS